MHVKVRSKAKRLITLTKDYAMYPLWPGVDTMVPSDVLETNKQWLANGDLEIIAPKVEEPVLPVAPVPEEPKVEVVPEPVAPVEPKPEEPKPETKPLPKAIRPEKPNRFLKPARKV